MNSIVKGTRKANMKLSLLLSSLLAGSTVANASARQGQSPLTDTTTSATIQSRLEDIVKSSPLLSFHRDIVQIESISRNEQDVGDFITEFLQARNFTVFKQPLPVKGHDSRPRFNIYAYPANNNVIDPEFPGVLLTSHIDTVPPFIPYSLSYDAGTTTINRDAVLISGRGTVDAKASVAAQVFATLETLSDTPDAPLALLFVVGEEISGDGMKYFSASNLNTAPSNFHTVIFGEPTDHALVSGHKGMVGFNILASGHAAHSGYPWLGRSAVSAILPALSRVDRLGDIPIEEGGLPFSPKFGPTTVNIGSVRAGVAANVVPAAAEAEVAVRLAAGTPEQARRIIRQAVVDATQGDADVQVVFPANAGYAPQDLDTDVEGFEIITVNYGTDVPNLVLHPSDNATVSRYLYGPGSIHVAHGDNEAITIAELEEAVRGYRRLIDAALERNQKQ